MLQAVVDPLVDWYIAVMEHPVAQIVTALKWWIMPAAIGCYVIIRKNI